MDYLSDRLKFDTDIYDELPDKDPENYTQGFCTFVYVTLSSRSTRWLANRVKLSNAKAIIPSHYQAEDEDGKPYSVAYVLHESDFDRTYFIISADSHGIIYSNGGPDPVFFHKGWVRQEYIPDFYSDNERRHRMIQDKHFQLMLPKEVVYDIFYKHDLTKKCYTPKNDGTDRCTGRKVYNCSRCFLSEIYGKGGYHRKIEL